MPRIIAGAALCAGVSVLGPALAAASPQSLVDGASVHAGPASSGPSSSGSLGVSASFVAGGALRVALSSSSRQFVKFVPEGIGRAVLQPLQAGPASVHGAVTSESLGPLSMWYRKAAAGVEQGFTLSERPPGGSGPISVTMRAEGALTAALSGSSKLEFHGPNGLVLDYADLSVTDALGAVVPSHFALNGSLVRIVVDDRGARYPLLIDPTISDPGQTTGDAFASSVAVADSGETIVGAPGAGGGDGAVYVFSSSGSKLATIGDPFSGSSDAFGTSVSISADGTVAAVGSPGQGSGAGGVVVYSLSGLPGTPASEQFTLTGSGTSALGGAVALSSDGSTLVVGGTAVAPTVYDAGAESSWSSASTTPTCTLGSATTTASIALASNGLTVVVGSPPSATVYTTTAWSSCPASGTNLANPGTSSGFGDSVALSSDGTTALVGATTTSGAGAAYVFNTAKGTTPEATIGASGATSKFGESVALAADGNRAAIGDTGVAHFYDTTGESWSSTTSPIGSFSGPTSFAAALATTSTILAIGAPTAGTGGQLTIASYAPTSFTISASPGSVTYGKSSTLSVNGLPAGSTGTVSFSSGGKPLCAAPITAGSGSCTTATTLGVSTYPLSATYSGDSSDLGSSATNAPDLHVTPAPLSVTASGGSQNYGGNPPVITAGYAGFVNSDNASSLSVQPTCSSNTTSVTPVGTYASSCGGAAASNYSISYVAGSVTVSPVSLTITANNQSKVYGAANPTLTVGYAGFVNSDNASSLSPGPTCSTTSASSGVGSYAITCSGASDPNYTIKYTSGTLTITTASLTITANNQSKTYGAANPTLTVGYAGFVNNDNASSLSPGPTCSTTSASSGVGSYAITCSGASDPNYTIKYTAGTLTITTAALTITANNQSKIYGAANPPLTVNDVGFVNGDSTSSLSPGPTCSTTPASSGVGSYAISCSGASDPNYTIGYLGGTFTINPAPLTITASSGTMTYGGTAPTISVAGYSGFVNGDGSGVLAGSASCSTSASSTSAVAGSPYSSVCSGVTAANYAITFAPGSVVVSAAPLIIEPITQVNDYGADPATPTYLAGGFVNGDSASSFSRQPTCTTTGTATSPVGGSYSITCAGAVDSNYSFTYRDGFLDQVAAPLTITAPTLFMVYGSAVPTITPTFTGLANGEGPAVLGGALSCSTTASSSSSAAGSPYPITCSGATDDNYAISYVPGSLTVSAVPFPVTITASSATMTYGGAVPTITASYSGLVNGDSAAAVAPTCTTSTSSSSAASGSPYVTSCSGAADPDYTFTYVPGTLTVNRASQSLTFTSAQPLNVTVGITYVPTASSTSGLAVAFSIDAASAGVCMIDSFGQVGFLAAGTCVIDANQAGNGNFNAAPQVQLRLVAVPGGAVKGAGSAVAAIKSSKLVISGGTGVVPIACSVAACVGSASLSEQVITHVKKGTATLTKKTTVILGRGSFSIARGKKGNVKVRLTAAGESLFAHASQHPVVEKLTIALHGGPSKSTNVTVS